MNFQEAVFTRSADGPYALPPALDEFQSSYCHNADEATRSAGHSPALDPQRAKNCPV